MEHAVLGPRFRPRMQVAHPLSQRVNRNIEPFYFFLKLICVLFNTIYIQLT
jgi:hypothetical protein